MSCLEFVSGNKEVWCVGKLFTSYSNVSFWIYVYFPQPKMEWRRATQRAQISTTICTLLILRLRNRSDFFLSPGKVSKFLQILLRRVMILNVPMVRDFSKIRILRNFQTFARLFESWYSIYPWREISQNLADFSGIQLNIFELSGQVVKAANEPIGSILSSKSLEISQEFWEIKRLERFWEISRLLLDLLSIDTQCTHGALTTDVF